MRPRIWIWGEPGEFPNYRRALEAAGAEAWVTRSAGAEALCRGLVLPGGGDVEPWRYGQPDADCRDADPVRDAAELRLLARFVRAGRPVLGICRGLQVINVYFGGTLAQDVPGHGRTGGADRLHPVRTDRFSLCPQWRGTMTVNSAHHQAADRLGERLRAAQWAPDGVVEALEHRTRPVWGVQWHPERLAGPAGRSLLAAFVDRCR